MAKGKLAFGAVVGAVAGFVSGILLAPKSGKETRDDIKKASLDTKDVAEKKAREAKNVAEQKAKEAKAWGEEVVGDVTDKATELKTRAERAVEGAKKGFSEEPKSDSKSKK